MKVKLILSLAIVAASIIFISSSYLATAKGNESEVEFSLGTNDEKIKGLSFVAPARPFPSDPMIEVQNVNASWIAVIPYGFIPSNDHQVYHGSERQWWGERKEGVIETIKLAKKRNLKVMLKPQIWMHGAWIGDFEVDSEEEWVAFEESYSKYLALYADIAQEYDVEMICIGTEFKKAMQVRTEYFYKLIDQIRERYEGPLTYSSNWDEYMDVPIWDKLDYIGISAYFPLTDSATPDHIELKKSWQPTVKALEKFSKKHKKKILFTEFGYLSLDGCAGKTWILEKQRDQYQANHEAQSIAIHCLFDTFWEKDWWAGGFIWKWYPHLNERRKNFQQKDYSPQGKLAQETLSEWYKKS